MRAGIREGRPLHEVTVDLVKFEHFLVSVYVLVAVYGVAIAALFFEIIVNGMKEERKKKRKARKERTQKSDNEEKQPKVAWRDNETKTEKVKEDNVDSTV